MTEKMIGFALLVFGLVIILASALNIYFIFSGQTHPVKLFDFPAVSLDLSSSLGLPSTGVKNAPMELASSALLNDTTNLFAHLFLVGFFVNVGAKIATLGIELLRPVVVKLKEKTA